MNLKKNMENRSKGGIPKEPNLPRLHTTITNKEGQSNYKSRFPFVGVLVFIFFTMMAFGYLWDGNARGVVFLWFSCILGFSVGSYFMVQRGKKLNEKVMIGVLLVVETLGGLLVTLYVFSMPASAITRGLALVMLVVGNIPLFTAIIAQALGRKELSERLLGWFVLQR